MRFLEKLAKALGVEIKENYTQEQLEDAIVDKISSLVDEFYYSTWED